MYRHWRVILRVSTRQRGSNEDPAPGLAPINRSTAVPTFDSCPAVWRWVCLTEACGIQLAGLLLAWCATVGGRPWGARPLPGLGTTRFDPLAQNLALNSAQIARSPAIARPVGVVKSKASLREIKPTPEACSSWSVPTRSGKDRPQRSKRQTTMASMARRRAAPHQRLPLSPLAGSGADLLDAYRNLPGPLLDVRRHGLTLQIFGELPSRLATETEQLQRIREYLGWQPFDDQRSGALDHVAHPARHG